MRQIPGGKLGIFFFAAIAVISSGTLGLGIIETTFRALPRDVSRRKRCCGQSRCRGLLVGTLVHPLLDAAQMKHAVAGGLTSPYGVALFHVGNANEADVPVTGQT